MHDATAKLDQWLAEATRGLCAEARERIEAEVRAEVERRVGEDGVPMAQALVELGDAAKARQRYRREYLTIQDVYTIKWWATSGGTVLATRALVMIILAVISSVAIAGGVALLLLPERSDLPFVAAVVSAFVIAFIVSVVVAAQIYAWYRRNVSLANSVRFSIAANVLFVFPYLTIMAPLVLRQTPFGDNPLYWPLVATVCIFVPTTIGFQVYVDWNFLRKIRCNSEAIDRIISNTRANA